MYIKLYLTRSTKKEEWRKNLRYACSANENEWKIVSRRRCEAELEKMLSVEKLFHFSLRVALQPALGISSSFDSCWFIRWSYRRATTAARARSSFEDPRRMRWVMTCAPLDPLAGSWNIDEPSSSLVWHKIWLFPSSRRFLHLVIFLLRHFDTLGSLRNNWLMKRGTSLEEWRISAAVVQR